MVHTIDGPCIERAVRHKHPGRWIGAAVLAVLAAKLGQFLITNPRYEWDVVWAYLGEESILNGLKLTLGLTVVSMTIGIVLGVFLAVCRLSENPVLKAVSWSYVWFFRGTPTLIQLIFFFYLSALLPKLSIGIPFGPTFFELTTNNVITPLLAAILGLGLNEGAYMSEIIRGGLLSVDAGQREAGRSLGMTGSRVMARVVLPQAMRFIVPPTGNQIITMLKATSLVSVIALSDLLYSAQAIYNRTFQTIPLLVVACIWYLAVTSLLYVGQYFIERHYGRSTRGASGRSFLQFLRLRPTVASVPAAPAKREDQ